MLSLLPRLRVVAPRFTRAVQTTQSTITTPNKPGTPNTSKTNEIPTEGAPGISPRHEIQESVQAGEIARHRQAPNRIATWSRSQRPREVGMSGPRFEQTDIEGQPAPWSAIELIHQQPVRWVKERIVACDGGGGPMGHPKVFINVDKPQVEPCGYCGLPFAHVKNKAHLLKAGADYPLE